MGASGDEGLTSAAFLCASSVVPALTKLFEDAATPPSQVEAPLTVAEQPSESTSDSTAPTLIEELPDGGQTIKLVRVMSKISGEEVDTWWGIHPQFQRDLQPQETKDLAQHMNRVARIVGERFAVVASLAQSSGDQPIGHA